MGIYGVIHDVLQIKMTRDFLAFCFPSEIVAPSCLLRKVSHQTRVLHMTWPHPLKALVEFLSRISAQIVVFVL